MKRSLRTRRSSGNPEHIAHIVDRVIATLGPPRRSPPDRAALKVVVNILREALEHVPAIPQSARSAMGTSIDIIEGWWPGTTIERMGFGR